ncbi:class I SAM-dependent methyltransferase [Haloglomus salinum]|jgi:ubiquinone/menaquinone biosynthesis C-methylase UbiE|uniref:class I SAM-dependent methyltransferase n=1 Tax=Haloglomus salinum TaxID=2962673 RepID=UPI0020C9F829|nr:methyltransferase domain-containing protein [Haloglomus salinum]
MTDNFRSSGAGDSPGLGTQQHKSVGDIAGVYADEAEALDRWRWLDRLFAGRYRKRQFGDAEGQVLDVACGIGANFRYLPQPVDLVGIDISPEMLTRAEAELARLDINGALYSMDAETLAFSDNSFDTVISSFSTCTFPDPVKALREMRRVCRGDGRILLLEHGQSDIGPVARLLDWRADAHYEKSGCRLTQRPLQVVSSVGVTVVDVRTEFLDIITCVEAVPE